MKEEGVIDGRVFRHVLSHYPTGVCVITAVTPEGTREGMIVGSFTSVSLDPPLVAFFPARESRSWARVQSAGRFCVNVLSSTQKPLCRQFAASGADKFDGVTHRDSPLGAPILDSVVAWIDCTLDAVHEAGDHFIAIGRVHALEVERPGMPLLFFQGGYGEFSAFQ
ncbi:flavin reductase family protein [Sphingomonas bisphenolicum]